MTKEDIIASKAAAELRRLHGANAELLEALNDIARGLSVCGPFGYLRLRDKARAVITHSTGEQNVL